MISRHTIYRLWLLLVVALLSQLTVLTQASGEFCVEAFEDRNGNGVHDSGEPFLTRGLGAQLLNADGIVIQSALIDNSPTAGRGLICFQAPPAEYTLLITSAEFSATTASNLTVNLANNDRLLLEYGGQRIQPVSVDTTSTSNDSGESQDKLVERVIVAGVGASVAMFLTLIIGFFLYLIFLRGRSRPQPQYYAPDDYRYRPPTTPTTGTGSMPRVPPPTDTGEYPRR